MRRIKRVKVTHLSLVPKGANRLAVLYKEDKTTDNIDFDLLVKADGLDDKGELLGVVYAPELVDTQGDIASRDVIRNAMHEAGRDGLKIDMRHDGKVLKKEDAYIAEQFEIQKGDDRFKDFKDRDGKAVDVTGGWGVLLKIDNPEIRKLYKSGEWGGISLMGDAVTVIEKDSDPLSIFAEKLLEKMDKKDSTGDIDMTEAQIDAKLNANNDTLLTKIAALIPKPVAKEEVKPADAPAANELKAPVLKADASSADLAVYLREHKRYTILKSIDPAKPATIEKAQTELAKLEKEDKKAPVKKADDAADDENAEQVTLLKSQIEELQDSISKLEKGSNQASDGEGSAGTGSVAERAKAAVAKRNKKD